MDETPKQEFARLRQLELHVSDFLWAVDTGYFGLFEYTLQESAFVSSMREWVKPTKKTRNRISHQTGRIQVRNRSHSNP